MTAANLLDGARNCVIDCAQIAKGNFVAIVNETGTDAEVVDTIAELAREAGARVDVIWADPHPKDDKAKIVPNVHAAFRDADILVNHYHSLSRAALQDEFPQETRVRYPTAPSHPRCWDRLGLAFPTACKRRWVTRWRKSWRLAAAGGSPVLPGPT